MIYRNAPFILVCLFVSVLVLVAVTQ